VLLSDYLAQAAQLEHDARALLDGLDPATRVDDAKGKLNALKDARLGELQGALRALAPEDRRDAGVAFNRLKTGIQEAVDAFAARQAAATQRGPTLDLTMPARRPWQGAVHPVTAVIDEICAIFRELGFTVALGPEAELEWYNFQALNFPSDHPAMDVHDTLYLAGQEGAADGEAVLLRTHTSPVQVRTLQRYRPPVRVVIPGMVYRRDFFDASHAPAFAQLEGLAVDEGISFVDLKATLAEFARRFFDNTRTRFRPSYFPFTEPSAEMDVQCQVCGGSGCATCKYSGWSEILGSGMVHPAVIEAAGLDSERYTGWAFGMGPARIAQQRHGVPDIRTFYDSDVRFLEQFAGVPDGAPVVPSGGAG
jgi:phenylalanyl-tRNA synthetase alpha chain